METLILVVVLLIAFASFLGALLLLRHKKQVNGNVSAPAAAGTGAPAPAPSEGWYTKYKQHVWTVLLVLLGAVIFYRGLYTPGLKIPQVGDWSWNHWLWILAFWVVLIALIALNAETLGPVAKTLRSVVTAGVILLFIGAPTVFWVRDLFLNRAICPDVSAHQTRSCMLNTAWSSWIKIADGPSSNGMQICFTPGGQFERTEANGTTFWRFKADEGRLVKAYRLFPGNLPCPTTLPD